MKNKLLKALTVFSGILFTAQIKAKTLVMIPGLGQPASVFDCLDRELSQYYKNIIKVDLPGHGENSDENFSWTEENIVNLIDGQVKDEEGSIDILGWSLGATIASLYTVKGGVQVDSLFLVGGIYVK